MHVHHHGMGECDLTAKKMKWHTCCLSFAGLSMIPFTPLTRWIRYACRSAVEKIVRRKDVSCTIFCNDRVANSIGNCSYKRKNIVTTWPSENAVKIHWELREGSKQRRPCALFWQSPEDFDHRNDFRTPFYILLCVKELLSYISSCFHINSLVRWWVPEYMRLYSTK